MPEYVTDHFDSTNEFDDLLFLAEQQASSHWEMDFVADIHERYDEYNEQMFLSRKQVSVLRRIAGEE